jgi:hypothetical protein
MFMASSAEKEYLLEYYSLVRAGKTAYVSNAAFQLAFGHRGQELPDFFEVYSVGALFLESVLLRAYKLIIEHLLGRVQAKEAAHEQARGIITLSLLFQTIANVMIPECNRKSGSPQTNQMYFYIYYRMPSKST